MFQIEKNHFLNKVQTSVAVKKEKVTDKNFMFQRKGIDEYVFVLKSCFPYFK